MADSPSVKYAKRVLAEHAAARIPKDVPPWLAKRADELLDAHTTSRRASGLLANVKRREAIRKQMNELTAELDGEAIDGRLRGRRILVTTVRFLFVYPGMLPVLIGPWMVAEVPMAARCVSIL